MVAQLRPRPLDGSCSADRPLDLAAHHVPGRPRHRLVLHARLAPPRRSRFVTPRKQNKSGAKGSTLIQKLVLSLFILIFLINFDRKFKFLKRRYRGSGRLCDHANFTPRAGDISKGVELEASVTLDI